MGGVIGLTKSALRSLPGWSAKSRGLADLEAEGLVAVERRAGHTARVKLLA